jgi:anti-anti-sigma factor
MHEALFKVATRYDGDAAILSLSGELDLAGERQLEEALTQARESAKSLTIDLTELGFIDSSGLRVLVRLQNTALRQGLDYKLISGPPQVHRTFVLCGLDQTLPFAA